jgi:flagellar basal-body rod modification protein FlgD
MSAASINSSIASLGNNRDNSGNGFAAMSSDEFIKVLITELSNQDPLKPTDSSALMEQMSSLRNIESQLSLQKSLESLVSQNAISSASGLLGKLVAGLNNDNRTVSGMVMGIRVQNGKPLLELDTGYTLAADRVTEIVEAK